jgi:formylglycine-generating enzyme required for sulfatase activity
MSDKEVTTDLFRRFHVDETYGGKIPDVWTGVDPKVSATPDHPLQMVSWIDAVLFCNWLSFQEDRKPCYIENPETGEWTCELESNGYRLPSDVQWEHACRAGTSTPYPNGSVEYLNQYAIYKGEAAAHMGGTLMCNRRGMLDMNGNVWEWTGKFPASLAATAVQTPEHRILRGGSRGTPSHRLKSDERSWHLPTHRSPVLGFRVALPSDPNLPANVHARSKESANLRPAP